MRVPIGRYYALLYLLAGCLSLFAAPALALDSVVLQLKWIHAFQFAGYYAAKEQGYYREAGLDVNILEATPTTDPVRDVIDGKAQYGVGTSSLILEREAGNPVVVLAVIFQQSPYEIYAAPGIRHLQDLIGKRLMLEPQTDELLAFLQKEGIPLDSIQMIPHSLDADGLMKGKAEAISGYITNEPYYFKQAQYPYQTFSPRSAGIDFYGDNLFTSNIELHDHPARVKAFRAATMKGWKYVKEHRDEIIELILAKYPNKNTRDFLHFESDQMIPLLQPNLIEIGYMNAARWRHIADTYASIGLLPADYPLDGFLYDAEKQDMSWFYRSLAIALSLILGISGVAFYIYRTNRRLVLALEKNRRTEEIQRNLDLKLQQMQKAESLSRMAGAIAHNYNNLLTAVIGNLELARLNLPHNSAAAENLTRALHAANRAATMSGLMLTYLGQSPGSQEPLDLAEVCRQCLPVLRDAMPQNVELEAILPTPGPIIKANLHQLQQLLTNLTTNAREAFGENRGVINLRVSTVAPATIAITHRFPLEWQPQDIEYACLEVTDTGCGISAKDVEKIFDPFYTTKFTGRGLGLPVVLGIVKAHGGAVTVESTAGGGSVLQLFCPLSNETTAPTAENRAIVPQHATGSTVLLVEDEQLVSDMAKDMLTSLGFTIITAKDGIEAVELFRQHKETISCVLCDLSMPRMDGWKTLAALRRLRPDIPVILTSGYDQTQVLAGDHTERPQAFLGKPYNLTALRETLCQVLGNMPPEDSPRTNGTPPGQSE